MYSSHHKFTREQVKPSWSWIFKDDANIGPVVTPMLMKVSLHQFITAAHGLSSAPNEVVPGAAP